MKILFITQWFPPEPGAFIADDIAEGLAGLGHEVHVLTGFPNYPSGVVMDGYKIRPYQREERSSGVTVHRAPLYPSHDQSMVRRGLNYLSFALGASAVSAKVPRCDVALVYSSPATAAIPALLQRLRGVPFVLLIQDLWPDSVVEASFVSGVGGRAASAALGAFCRLTYRLSATVCVISPGMAQLLEGRGVPARKLAYTPNWISDRHLHPDRTPSPDLRRQLSMPSGRTFLYAGNFGDLQDLPSVLEGFGSVPEANLVLVGNGLMKEDLVRLVAKNAWSNVSILPPQGSESIGEYLAACDVQIVSLRDNPLLRVTMPSKVQTALASGRPVLACCVGDAAELVTGGGAGMAATPGNPESVANAVRQLMAMSDEQLLVMGVRSRALYEQQLSPAVGPTRLATVLENAR